MVTLNVINLVGAGIKMTRSAVEAWASLTVMHNVRSNLALIHAKKELTAIKYANRMSIEAHFKAMHTGKG